MILLFVKLVLSLAIPICLGCLILKYLLKIKIFSLPLLVAFSFGLGLGLLSYGMFIMAGLGLILSFQSILITLLIISLFAYYFLRKGKFFNKSSCEASPDFPGFVNPVSTQKREGKFSILVLLTILYIIFQIFIVFWYSLNVPVSAWDDFFNFATKAKVIYFEGSLDQIRHLTYPSYPLLVPLAQVWIALSLGMWDDQLIKIIFPMAFLSFLIIYFYTLKFFTDGRGGIYGLGLLLSSSFFILHATINYSDFYQMYYNYVTIFLILIWTRVKTNGLLVLISLFAGLSAFTKIEGLGYLMLHLILLLIILTSQKQEGRILKIKRFLMFALPSLSLYFLYFLYKWHVQIPWEERTHLILTIECFQRIPQVLFYMFANLFLSGNWNILWFILLVSLFNLPNTQRKPEIGWMFFVLILFLGYYFGLGVFTNHFPYIGDKPSAQVLSRILLHQFPVCPFLIALLNYPGNSK